MFDAMMEWMAVPLLFGEHGEAPEALGLTHFSVAPYGVFQTRDGGPILISVQNDREWVVLCSKVLDRPELATDPRFATNPARIANRAETDAFVARCFGARNVEALRTNQRSRLPPQEGLRQWTISSIRRRAAHEPDAESGGPYERSCCSRD